MSRMKRGKRTFRAYVIGILWKGGFRQGDHKRRGIVDGLRPCIARDEGQTMLKSPLRPCLHRIVVACSVRLDVPERSKCRIRPGPRPWARLIEIELAQ